MIHICLFIVAILCSQESLAENYQPDRIEPPNWWVGMHHSTVQLMLYGENIAALTPTVLNQQVAITDVSRTDNKNYLFVTLDLGKMTKPAQIEIALNKMGQQKGQFLYPLYAREKGSAEREGFSSKDAVYLITPDRFANGNVKNDSVAGLTETADRNFSGGRHGGDIAGMVKHLDYIAAMGFTQIWPNPLLENNQPKYSYHGYAATNNYLIDPRFGTNKEYQHFVAQARQKGIGVIQDIILNHIGSKHWWIEDLPAQDWLNNSDAYVETNHHRTTVQDPYAAPADKEQFVSGWFSPDMPDLNQRNPLLANYLIQNTLWWIEYAGLSGVREDTYGYADKTFLAQWAKAVMTEYPNLNIVGEEWSNNPAIVAHWQRGKTNSNGYVSYVPSMMDFPVYEALRTGLADSTASGQGFMHLYETLANDFLYPDPFNLMIFSENHDTSRIYSYLNEDRDLFKMAMVYIATMRGIPQFYYGSEVLMTSPRERDDGAVRADMPGGWQGDKQNAFTGQGLTHAQLDMQAYIKHLLNWRKTSEVVHSGKLQHFAPVDGVYVYFRYNDTQTVMVVLNKNDQEKTLSLIRFGDFLQNKSRGHNVMENKDVDLTKPLSLPKKSSMIIAL